ncbi:MULTISPECIES: Gp37-like protein [Nocardia]|uniref:Gp37-like protein n=1 Tax=Nocardia TaxID=1817 RepID=UPI000D69A776|nr:MULTISPECIES: hypothetical protein [Nocardia]
MTAPLDLDSMTLAEQCEAIWDATLAADAADHLDRRAEPLVRLWDGHWRLAGLVCSEYRAEFTWIDNDTGTALIELPLDDPLAKWVWQTRARVEAGEGRNIHITCDKAPGSRWSGRLIDHSIERRADGTQVLTLRFVDDFQHCKSYLIWSNPFFDASVQIPRTFGPVPGPARWALKLPLFLNVMREQSQAHGWQLPDDPLDPASWLGAVGLDMSQWSVVVAPTSFAEDLAAGTLWATPHSRFKYWYDMARDILEDAELSVRCRRWLEGDPPPWPGAPKLRHGTLVIDIVNTSGYYSDTSNGGNPFDGLVRTVARFSEDFIDSVEEAIIDPVTPAEYLEVGQRRTQVSTPFAVYFDSPTSGVETSKFTETASTAVQIVTGGSSMPGVAGAPPHHSGGAPATRTSRRKPLRRCPDGWRPRGRHRGRPAAGRGGRRADPAAVSGDAIGLARRQIPSP